MKTLLIYTIISIMITPFMLIGQPKAEFELQLSVTEIEVKPGETKTIDINLIRSKGYQKYKAKFGFSSPNPEGISLTYNTGEGLVSANTLSISVSENAKEDSYMLLPNCVLNNKTKSAVLKLVVKPETAVSRGK